MKLSFYARKLYTKYRYWRLMGLEKKKEYGGTVTWEKSIPDKVLVLGNGPSLKDTDVAAFANDGYELLCVNFFPQRDPRFLELKPRYLCLIDPAFYEEEKNRDREDIKQLFEKLNIVDWKLNIITMMGVKMPVENVNINYIYLCEHEATEPYYPGLKYDLYRKNILSCGFQNVVIGALFYLIANGCKNICVTGIDMSEFRLLSVDEDNNICMDAEHFYGKEKRKVTFVGRGEFYLALKAYQRMFEEFHYIAEFAAEQNSKILNLSLNSYVDVFEKKTPDSVVAGSK